MIKKNYCTIYLIRHGETEWNIGGLIQGHKDSILTETGVRQAKELGNALKQIKFSAIFSSDLLRAKRTAEIIALDRKIALKTSQSLRERAFGKFEGQSIKNCVCELRELLNKRGKLEEEDLYKYKLITDVENNEELMGRFITYLREISIAYLGKKILLVTHGGVMRTFLIHLGFAKYSELPSGSISNAAYLVIESDGTDFFVKKTIGVNKNN